MEDQEGRIQKRTHQFVRALENSDQKLLTDLLFFGDDQELSDIKDMLLSNKWILPRVCELGFLNVLQIINDFHLVDINIDYKGKTGLLYACQEGHTDVVTWLLDHGASLNKNSWEENSEFYLATLNGNEDVISILVSKQPEMAQDISVCYCLMYAACCGGHVELVKRWFAPGMDVRETIAYTTDLSNCEQKYPLFAACEGEHLEVAKFLICECQTAITPDICLYFPQLTTKLVRSLFLRQNTKHLRNFSMANSKIECILPCWFSEETRSLKPDDIEEEETLFEIIINLKQNRLRKMPDEVLFTLRELISLDASNNPLRSISSSLDSSLLALNQLKFLSFSQCELESLSNHIFDLPCLEQLNLSYNKLTTLGVKEATENATTKNIGWKCTRLHSLDVSHNLLSSFSTGIQTCAELNTLTASYNQLTTACTPWQCPMEVLDLSNNKLTAFAPSADQYWKKTLKCLYLQNNQINELPESIVNMRLLEHLDVSNNAIQQIPPPKLWCCPLMYFNLNNNQLGVCKLKTLFQKITPLNITPEPQLEFPKSCLAHTLLDLYIANNDLKTVPNGVGDLENLSVLDLSGNVKINELPFELGKLKKLLNLQLGGITVKDKELQSLISSLEGNTKTVYPIDVINYLERKRRNCAPQDILKIVVLGCKNKNGPCIVQKLVNSKDTSIPDHENLTVTRLTPKQKKSLTYEIWEIPDIKVTPALLPYFLSQNSLYIIVHDASYFGADLHLVSEKVSSIQAHVLHPKIIVVCTYSKSMEKSVREKLEKEIMVKQQRGFQKEKFISVTLAARKNVDPLQQEIYSAWEAMGDAVYDRDTKLLQHRQVPEMFVNVVNRVKKLQQNIYRMDDFLQAIGCIRKDLDDGIDEKLKMHEFLLQVGAMLHYNNHMVELSDCVILNPTWLFKVLSKFLESLTNLNDTKITQLSISEVKAKFQDELPNGDYDYFPAFLKLLEYYNIGIRMSDSANKKDEVLLVPCLLPKQPPQFQFDKHNDACKASRLYCLSAVSPVLWSHVISQLILAFERFSSPKWKLVEQKSNASATIDKTKSFRMGCAVSLKGLNIYNKNIHFWRTGITMHNDQGHVIVEQVACTYRSVKQEPGILVTVQTTGSLKSGNEIDPLTDNTKKLSMMGIVIDELEEILELFNPKFRNPSEFETMHIYAVCPRCHDIKPGSGCVDLENIHFKVRDCAQVLLSKDVISCLKGHTLLAHLVPELLFLELPPELVLTANDIVLVDDKLGHGITGSVTKGIYKGTEVAVKVFFESTISAQTDDDDESSLYQNVSCINAMGSHLVLSRHEQDKLETEQLKISNAFSEVRREVGILSKLRHESVVTFIGLCFKLKLLLVMELAPLGSLRNELDKRTEHLSHEIENPDTVISQMIFSKDLTYKIILQIGSGLSYLHSNSIIYRDLKPDNILVFSLSTDDRVNIKLSDYGISKFTTLQGVTGLRGTRGYMAPEVENKQPYTEQADIYSYAMVMLEVLTGIHPSGQLQTHCWNAVSDRKIPSHIQGRKVHTNFPYLQILMEECWNYYMDKRPKAKNIVKRLKADQFLLLHDSVWLDNNPGETLNVTCIYSCQTLGRWNIWISESGCGNHRYFSVYDVSSCGFNIYRQQCHGPQVVDMTRVGSRIWLVCKGLTNLQVIVRGTQSKFEVCHGVSLQASARKILSHSMGTSEESESFLLVGLEDGSVAAYRFNTYHKKSVTLITIIEFNRSIPVAQMCSINSNMVAVVCGMTVYMLHVELPDIQSADKTGKKGILKPEFVNYGSVSLKNVLNIYDPIISVVAEGDAIWCAMENSSCLVKVNTKNKNIEQVITLNWETLRDTIIFNEMKSIPDSHTRQTASDSQATSDISESEKNTRKFQCGHCNNSVDDVFPETSFSSKTTKASIGKSSDYDPPLRHSESHAHSSQCRRDSSETSSDNNSPPVLLRPRPTLTRNTGSLPEFGTQHPPPVPKRGFYQEVAVMITSLALSVDTLIVGTSCGSIVQLPLIYRQHSDTSGNLPLLPFHLPMLRHPTKEKEQRAQLRTFTADMQIQHATGSISALTLANDKLISLHSVQSQVLRKSRKSKQVGSKRYGSLFSAQSIEVLNSQQSTDEVNPSNTSGSTSSLGSDSELSHHSNVTLTDQSQYEVANIAVWDNLTRERLKIVRSYGHELVNCRGLCCHAPDKSKPAADGEIFYMSFSLPNKLEAIN